MTGRWRRSPRAIYRWLPDGVVLLSLDGGDPSVVVGPGGVLWDLLEQPVTTDALVQELATLYESDPDQVRADVEPLLAQLTELGFVAADPGS